MVYRSADSGRLYFIQLMKWDLPEPESPQDSDLHVRVILGQEGVKKFLGRNGPAFVTFDSPISRSLILLRGYSE